MLRDVHRFHGMQAGADAFDFDQIGIHLASAGEYSIQVGHPTAFRAPGFPFVLAGIYAIAPGAYPLVYLALCLIGAATSIGVYALAREVLPETTARVAALLLAIYLPHVYFSTLIVSEALFGLLMVFAFFFFVRSIKNSSNLTLLAAGILLGLCILTRPFGLLLCPLLAAILFWFSGRNWAAVGKCLFLAVTVIVAITPWTLRNFALFHRPVLITTNGGSTLYGSNNDIVLNDPKYWGTWISTVQLPGRDIIEAAPDEVSHDAIEQKLGLEWVAGHITSLPKLLSLKLLRLVIPDTTSGNRTFIILQAAFYLPVAFLTAWGVWKLSRKTEFWNDPAWLAIHSAVAALFLQTLIYYGSSRFRDTIAPVFLIYAAGVLASPPRSVPTRDPA